MTTLPKTDSQSTLSNKPGPKRKGSCSNHWNFQGFLAVSFRGLCIFVGIWNASIKVLILGGDHWIAFLVFCWVFNVVLAKCTCRHVWNRNRCVSVVYCLRKLSLQRFQLVIYFEGTTWHVELGHNFYIFIPYFFNHHCNWLLLSLSNSVSFEATHWMVTSMTYISQTLWVGKVRLTWPLKNFRWDSN